MRIKPGTKVSLKKIDPDGTGSFASENEAKELLRKQLDELVRLQNLLYAENKRALLIVLQGMDTSGKDGTIRHVMSGLSPLGVIVKAFKAPTEEELSHDFLWRGPPAAARPGYIRLFKPSHYEELLGVP